MDMQSHRLNILNFKCVDKFLIQHNIMGYHETFKCTSVFYFWSFHTGIKPVWLYIALIHELL